MKIIMVSLLITVFLVVGGCSAKTVYKSEFDFANKLGQEGLWKEAHYRWQKILAEGKESAALYNNIAVALEEMGRFNEAEEAYKKALKLAPHNSTIQGNHDMFKKLSKKPKSESKDEK